MFNVVSSKMPAAEQTPSFARVRDVMEQDFDFLAELRDLVDVEDPSNAVAFGGLKYDRQTIRRLYVRTLVSLVESVVATLKQDALEIGTGLSVGEKLLLAEETFDLNDKGEAIQKVFIASLPKSLKFAFRSFAKAHGLTRLPDYSANGWEDFQELVKIRNRLTHPKDPGSLEITDAEMAIADRAEFWFLRSNTTLLKEYNEHLRAQVESSALMQRAGEGGGVPPHRSLDLEQASSARRERRR